MNDDLRRAAAHVFVESLAAPDLDDDDRHHLVRVLRLRDGEIVTVGDGAGSWRRCRISAAGVLVADGNVHAESAPLPPISVGFAIPKGDRPEWIVQKLTEIGVDRIILLHAGHSVVRWEGDKADRQRARLTKVAREAAMQSRRLHLPVVSGPVDVASLLAGGATQRTGDVALAEPGGGPLTLARPSVLIGPEGGWTPAELAGCAARVSLGTTVLRVETAALVAAARLVAARGMMHGVEP